VGHKTADTSFFGYKTHLVLIPERIITAYAVTLGEKPDGKELDGLITLTEKAGIKVETVVGDAAYSTKDNLEMAKERKIKLIAKMSEMITHNHKRTLPILSTTRLLGCMFAKQAI